MPPRGAIDVGYVSACVLWSGNVGKLSSTLHGKRRVSFSEYLSLTFLTPPDSSSKNFKARG